MRYNVKDSFGKGFTCNADGPGYAAEKFAREFRGNWTGDETETLTVRDETGQSFSVAISVLVRKEYIGCILAKSS